jgi:hypothetical protein
MDGGQSFPETLGDLLAGLEGLAPLLFRPPFEPLDDPLHLVDVVTVDGEVRLDLFRQLPIMVLEPLELAGRGLWLLGFEGIEAAERGRRAREGVLTVCDEALGFCQVGTLEGGGTERVGELLPKDGVGDLLGRGAGVAVASPSGGDGLDEGSVLFCVLLERLDGQGAFGPSLIKRVLE